MFTGIVEEIGVVKAIAKGTHSIKLSIKSKKVLENTQLGDSIGKWCMFNSYFFSK